MKKHSTISFLPSELLLLTFLFFLVCFPVAARQTLPGSWSENFGLPLIMFADSSAESSFNYSARNSIRGIIPLGEQYGNDYLLYGRFNLPGKSIVRRTADSFERFTAGIDGEIFTHTRNGDTLYLGIATPRRQVDATYSIKGIRISTQEIFDVGVQGISLNQFGKFDLETLCFYNGILYAGGNPSQLTGENPTLWRYDGTQWKHDSTSAMSVRGVILGLTSFKGKLYAHGYITAAGDDSTKKQVIVWDGTSWQNLFSDVGYTSPVKIVTIVGADSSYLYVSGQFNRLQLASGKNVITKNFSYFNGSEWFSTNNDTAFSVRGFLLPTYCTSRNDSLFVCGRIDTVGGIAMNNIAVYDIRTQRWGSIGNGIPPNPQINSSVRMIYPSRDELHTYGTFIRVGSINGNGFARFRVSDGQVLPHSPYHSGGIIDVSQSYSIFPYKNSLAIFGSCKFSGSGGINHLATYSNESGWTPINGGFSAAGVTLNLALVAFQMNYPGMRSFSAFQDGNSLFLAGRFDHLSTRQINAIAHIDSAGTIRDLDSGVRFSRLQHLLSKQLMVYPMISDMKKVGDWVYATGDYVIAGNDTNSGKSFVNGISAWNGTSWRKFGLGLRKKSLKNLYDAPIGYSLALLPDSSLLVSGEFDLFDTVACRNLVRLTPSGNVEPFGFAPADTLSRNCKVYTFGDTIIVVGQFTHIGGKEIANMAIYDGKDWMPLTYNASNTTIYDIVSHGEYLYFCGNFDSIGTVRSSGVAAWNRRTHTWHSLGKGVGYIPPGDSVPRGGNRTVTGMVVLRDTIYFAGNFDYADGKPSFGIAAWIPEKKLSVESDIPQNQARLYVHPNPAGTILTIQPSLPSSEKVTIDLVNVLGQSVMKIFDGELHSSVELPPLRIDTLPQGVYFVRMMGISTNSIQAVTIIR